MLNTNTYSSRFLLIATAFVTVLIVSNTVATKIIQIGSLSLAGGILIFPLSYIFGDILTEVYGYKASRKIIWVGFAALIFTSLIYWLVQIIPAAPFWPGQAAYESILGLVPRLVVAGIIGYFLGEFSNSYVLSRMKIWSGGRHLWARTIGSTVVGELVDTLSFVLIAFYGLFDSSHLITMIISIYLVKVIYEILSTPFTYLIVNKLKKAEGIDVFDKDVNYNPFTTK